MTTSVNFSDITPDQIGKCSKIYDYQTRSNFYQVENSKGDIDDNGNIIVYEVRYSREHGFTCQCKAGQEGFVHCKGYCWHVRAALAASAEEKQALKALSQACDTPKTQPQTPSVPSWMLTARPAPHMCNRER